MTRMGEQRERNMTLMAEQHTKYLESKTVARIERKARKEMKDSIHEKFLKLNPPEYSGSVETAEAEMWVRDLETIFAVMKVLDNQKVNLAVFRLKVEAKYWWEASNHLVPMMEGISVVTWAEFIKALYVKYFPKVYRREKVRDFINLTQGKMSVR